MQQSPVSSRPHTDCFVKLRARTAARAHAKNCNSKSQNAIRRRRSKFDEPDLSLSLPFLIISELPQLKGFIYACLSVCTTSDGFSYERSAIVAWITSGRHTSPLTNLPLTSSLVFANNNLSTVIKSHLDQWQNDGGSGSTTPAATAPLVQL